MKWDLATWALCLRSCSKKAAGAAALAWVLACLPDPDRRAPSSGSVGAEQESTLRPGLLLTFSTVANSNSLPVPADGISTLALWARVRDASGNPLSGARVSFSGSASANDTFYPASATTDCSGLARTSLASTRPGDQTLTAQIQATRSALQVSFSCPGLLSPPIASPHGGFGHWDLTPGDLDGDGRADLVVSAKGSLSVLMGRGNGSFLPGQIVQLAESHGLTLCDLNRDGRPDLVASSKTTNQLLTFIGRGDGTFAAPSRWTTSSSPYEIACIDLNLDGNLDVAVGASTGTTLSTHLGNGDGSLQSAVAVSVGTTSSHLAAGLLNSDAYPDLLVGSGNANTLVVLLNAGDSNGSLSIGSTLPTAKLPTRVGLADYDGDGRSDLVVTLADSTATIWLASGDGNFSLTSTQATVASPYSLAVGDYNGDGKQDLVVGSGSASSLAFHSGTGSGSLAVGVNATSVARTSAAVLAVDVDGNNSLDLAVGSGGGTQVYILLNRGSGSFVPAPNIAAPTGTYGLGVGKYALDAMPLVATTTPGGNGLYTYTSPGDATLTNLRSLGFGAYLTNLVVADFNRDQRADVAMLSTDTYSLTVLLGDGTGNLTAPFQTSIGTGCRYLAAGDLNNDSNTDLVLSCQDAQVVVPLLGAGDGSFGLGVAMSVGLVPTTVSLGDINGDQNLDVVVAHSGSATLGLLLGDGQGGLGAMVPLGAGGAPAAAALADLNGDGRPDFISALSSNDLISVILGNGTVAPGGMALYATGSGPSSLLTVDLNADGWADVLVSNLRDGTLSLLQGRGDGSLLPAVSYASGVPTPNNMVAFDANGDGNLDVLLSSTGITGRSLPLLLNVGCTPATSSLLGANANVNLSYDNSQAGLAGGIGLQAQNGEDLSRGFTATATSGLSFDANRGVLRLADAGGCNGMVTNCNPLDPRWTPRYASLTAYWTLDGNGTLPPGSTVAAQVGPSLQASGASLVYQTGKLAQGLSLSANGNGSLTLPASTPASPNLTFLAWVRADGGAPNQRIFDFGSNANSYFSLTPRDGNGRLQLTLVQAPTVLSAVAPFALSPGSWQHLALTLDGNQARIYVAGQQVANVATSLTAATLAGPVNTLGSNKPADPAFAGALDDVALFSAALNANEISMIYRRQAPRYAGLQTSRIYGPLAGSASWSGLAWQTLQPAGKPLPSGGTSDARLSYPEMTASNLGNSQVLLWHLDEGGAGAAPGGNDARDDSGQANHGKAYNGPSLGQAGWLGGSFGFAGSNSTRVAAVQTSYINASATLPSLAMSLSLWFNAQAGSGGQLIGFGDGQITLSTAASVTRQLYLDSSSRLTFGFRDNAARVLTSSATVADGRWHHAAATFGNSIMRLYVDGRLDSAQALSGSILGQTGAWHIGGDVLSGWNAAPSSAYFSGRLDEVSVWERALSADEVLALWRRGATRLSFLLRACSSMSCADNPSWTGPDGTLATAFSEMQNNVSPQNGNGDVRIAAPDLLLSRFAPALPTLSAPYLQVQIHTASDDTQLSCVQDGQAAPCMAELSGVRLSPSTYPTSARVSSTVSTASSTLTGLALRYGAAGCPAGARVNLSNDGGVSWYWFNGYVWTSADGSPTQSTPAAALTGEVLALLPQQRGAGPLSWRVFLLSDGSNPCTLGEIELLGRP